MERPEPAITDEMVPARPAFISYATADRRQALSVCTALEKRGRPCWISCRDVAPGENYQEAIVRAIRGARAVVLIFSKAANTSDEIKKELSLASRYRVPVFALRTDDVEPSDAFAYELSTRQWLDAFEQWDKSLDVLAIRVAQVGDGENSSTAAFRRPSHPQFKRMGRRTALLAGGAVIAASTGGLVWLDRRRGDLPPDAQKLVDDGHAALDETTVEGFATAVARFRQATELAPNRAEPWGGLALAYRRQAGSASSIEEQSLRARADNARRRALVIDPDNGDALAAGVAALPMFGNWLAHERACRAALQRQPKHSQLNMELVSLLTSVGRLAATPPLIDQALSSDPRFVFAHVLKIGNLDDLNRLDEAEAAVETATRIWPRHYAIWFARIYYLAINGRATEALAMIDDPSTRPLGIPEWNFAITRLQLKAWQTRAKPDVDAAITAGFDSARRGAGFTESAILFAGGLGRIDETYRLIDAYYFGRGFDVGHRRWTAEQGQFSSRRRRNTFFLFRKFMQPVRADRRFRALSAALGLDDYWKKSGTVPDYRANPLT